MKVYDATEQAYKSGYNAGVKEFSERLKNKCGNTDLANRIIDAIADELTEKGGVEE